MVGLDPPRAGCAGTPRGAQRRKTRKVLLRYNTGHAVLADFAVQEVEHSDLASQRLALRHVLHVLGALHDQVTSLGVAEFQQELSGRRTRPSDGAWTRAEDARRWAGRVRRAWL